MNASGVDDDSAVTSEYRVRYVLPHSDELSVQQVELVDRIAGGPRAQQAGVVPLVDVDGRLSGVFSLMPIAPAVGDRVQAVGAALRFETSLDAFTRELAILVVAAHRGSDFEWFAHERAARDAGATSEHLAAIAHGEAVGGVPPQTALALDVVTEILRDGGLSDDTYVCALDKLGEQALAELVWLQGYYTMLATALATFRPPLPPGASGVLSERRLIDPEPQS